MSNDCEEETSKDELEQIRDSIEMIDNELALLISRRFMLAKQAGEIKHSRGMPIKVPEMERKVIERAKHHFREHEQNEQAAKEIWEDIIKWSLDVQKTWF